MILLNAPLAARCCGERAGSLNNGVWNNLLSGKTRSVGYAAFADVASVRCEGAGAGFGFIHFLVFVSEIEGKGEGVSNRSRDEGQPEWDA